MEIIIDSREKGRVKEALYYYEDAKVEKLEFGDYVFKDNDKTVAFEFKTCEDYISSIKNKSLFEELANQTDEYDYSFLIVCGKLYETAGFGYPVPAAGESCRGRRSGDHLPGERHFGG